jgi:predicted dehydrogenase
MCDASGYVLGVLEKYTGVKAYSDFETMLDEARPDAVLIATPSRTHAAMVRTALERGIHVFCEKPFTLSPADADALSALAAEKGLVTQVGYHNRFVGAFREVKRLLDLGAIGRVTHVLGEAYGPVVLKAKGSTWRSKAEEGGGSLYDYAAHPIDLLTWYLGAPSAVGGTVLNSIFSREIDDEVYSTMYYPDGLTARVACNWSDESYRKMTTRITVWGTEGRISADRQECQTYLRDTATAPEGYAHGWNVRYTTELTEPVGYYLRGEEYSAQVEHFVARVQAQQVEGENGFASAAVTDRVIALMKTDAAKGPATADAGDGVPAVSAQPVKRRWWRARRGASPATAPSPAVSQLDGSRGA